MSSASRFCRGPIGVTVSADHRLVDTPRLSLVAFVGSTRSHYLAPLFKLFAQPLGMIDLLLSPSARKVVTGPGGIGKARDRQPLLACRTPDEVNSPP